MDQQGFKTRGQASTPNSGQLQLARPNRSTSHHFDFLLPFVKVFLPTSTKAERGCPFCLDAFCGSFSTFSADVVVVELRVTQRFTPSICCFLDDLAWPVVLLCAI